jgi:hypothetical protein
MPIDIRSLRQHIRQELDTEELLRLLDRAIELIPQEQLPQLIEGFFGPDLLQVDATPNKAILDEVRDFYDSSFAGVYYEDFRVNSRNFMDRSRGTINWIAEFNRLMQRCVEVCRDGDYPKVQQAFDLLFELLDTLDEDPDAIIFFADEAGAWQVGVDWDTVLPAYFTALANVAKPKAYAQAVLKVVTAHVDYDRDKHLQTALKVAKPTQQKAIRALM